MPKLKKDDENSKDAKMMELRDGAIWVKEIERYVSKEAYQLYLELEGYESVDCENLSKVQLTNILIRKKLIISHAETLNLIGNIKNNKGKKKFEKNDWDFFIEFFCGTKSEEVIAELDQLYVLWSNKYDAKQAGQLYKRNALSLILKSVLEKISLLEKIRKIFVGF